MGSHWSNLMSAIIRPPRNRVQDSPGGQDVTLTNDRGQKLRCTWWNYFDSPRPVVIFLHGNCSCRCAVMPILPQLLNLGCSVFAFDFAGSGVSDGEYVSLGYYEQHDVRTVVEYLRESEMVTKIALWGHSMGAATALLYGSSDPSIAAMICDSTFSSLDSLARDVISSRFTRISVPFTSIIVQIARRHILHTAEFDICKVVPIDSARGTFIPALFMHGDVDELIPKSHSMDVHDAYPGDKELMIMEKVGHNTPRPDDAIESATLFLYRCLYLYNVEAIQADSE